MTNPDPFRGDTHGEHELSPPSENGKHPDPDMDVQPGGVLPARGRIIDFFSDITGIDYVPERDGAENPVIYAALGFNVGLALGVQFDTYGHELLKQLRGEAEAALDQDYTLPELADEFRSRYPLS